MYSLSWFWKSLPVVLLLTIPLAGVAKQKRQFIPISEVVRIVTQEGYSDIRDIELSRSDNDNKYEVTAHTKEGKEIEIELDATTGKVQSRDE